jgi:hypothetical protein
MYTDNANLMCTNNCPEYHQEADKTCRSDCSSLANNYRYDTNKTCFDNWCPAILFKNDTDKTCRDRCSAGYYWNLSTSTCDVICDTSIKFVYENECLSSCQDRSTPAH